MVRCIAKTADTCRQPGDGSGFGAQALTHLLLPRLTSGQVNLEGN
jgi:hypothetical protein